MTVAWAEADRKVREAALARKRAREALEHLLYITREERARKENDNVSVDLSDANLAKVEDLDLDMDNGDGDGDGDIDVDLVRQLEDSLVKDEDIDCKFN